MIIKTARQRAAWKFHINLVPTKNAADQKRKQEAFLFIKSWYLKSQFIEEIMQQHFSKVQLQVFKTLFSEK